MHACPSAVTSADPVPHRKLPASPPGAGARSAGPRLCRAPLLPLCGSAHRNATPVHCAHRYALRPPAARLAPPTEGAADESRPRHPAISPDSRLRKAPPFSAGGPLLTRGAPRPAGTGACAVASELPPAALPGPLGAAPVAAGAPFPSCPSRRGCAWGPTAGGPAGPACPAVPGAAAPGARAAAGAPPLLAPAAPAACTWPRAPAGAPFAGAGAEPSAGSGRGRGCGAAAGSPAASASRFLAGVALWSEPVATWLCCPAGAPSARLAPAAATAPAAG